MEAVSKPGEFFHPKIGEVKLLERAWVWGTDQFFSKKENLNATTRYRTNDSRFHGMVASDRQHLQKTSFC